MIDNELLDKFNPFKAYGQVARTVNPSIDQAIEDYFAAQDKRKTKVVYCRKIDDEITGEPI